jgi:NifU-like protein involved in Fe-S cluster formation
MMAKRLSNKTLSEIKKIKASNDAYYKALSARDMRAMEKLWTCAADNMLIAPPANPRVYVGWSAIKRNWEVVRARKQRQGTLYSLAKETRPDGEP